MTDESDPCAPCEPTSDRTSSPLRSLSVEDGARLAGCEPAYLAECIACGQLASSGHGFVDADALAAWVQRSLRPQQSALRAVVDAIDAMELRSLKPAAAGEAAASAA